MTIERVGDLDDPRLADFAALSDPAARRRLERAGGHFIAEGPLVLEQLLASDHPIRCLLVAEDAVERVEALVDGREVTILVAAAEQVRAITGFAFHRGVLASADRLPLRTVDDVVRGAARLLVVESVNDHENLGALFRNAAALGADAVLLDPTTADPLYRRTVRVSLGHVLRVPWTRVPVWPDGLDELRAVGFTVVALTPADDAAPLSELAGSPPSRLALLVGAEGPGLSPGALRGADRHVRIEMRTGVDSLNVATAAAIAMHALGQGTGT